LQPQANWLHLRIATLRNFAENRMGLTDIEKRLLKGGAALPDLNELPVRVPRDKAAKLISRYFFEVSPRSMERWPLVWRRVNGKAHCETADAIAVAKAMLDAASPSIGGYDPTDK
jgi:hypothetical protein